MAEQGNLELRGSGRLAFRFAKVGFRRLDQGDDDHAVAVAFLQASAFLDLRLDVGLGKMDFLVEQAGATGGRAVEQGQHDQ